MRSVLLVDDQAPIVSAMSESLARHSAAARSGSLRFSTSRNQPLARTASMISSLVGGKP